MKNIIYIKQFLSGEPVKSGPNVHGSNKFISGTKLAQAVQILNSFPFTFFPSERGMDNLTSFYIDISSRFLVRLLTGSTVH